MENPLFHKIHPFLSLLFLLHYSSIFSFASGYALPDKYFINCGSESSSAKLGSQTFNGDINPGTSTLSGKTSSVGDSSASDLYESARIFWGRSWYELDIDKVGTYVVRFHFLPFPSRENLSSAKFGVIASGFSLLSNFSVNTNSNLPVIEEFLLTVYTTGNFKIHFIPQNSFAFVNAIEMFLTPNGFIPDSPSSFVTPQGNTKYNGSLLSSPLHVIHRINVGGENITPEYDNMLRSWIPDDAYLINKNSVHKAPFYGGELIFDTSGPGASSDFDAPERVYKTAKELSKNKSRPSWNFGVKKRATHFVRLHFCDIVSQTSNEFLYFSLFIYANFSTAIRPYDDTYQNAPAAPFLVDIIVDPNDIGFINISIDTINGSRPETAFLNGVEIMEIINDLGSASGGGNSKNKDLFMIIGLCIGGTALILILLGVLCIVFRRKKSKANEPFDLQEGHLYGWSSYSKTPDRNVNGSHFADLNLGLKVPFLEIINATKNFDARLMIGKGGFGKVYKGRLRNGTKVAVKRSEPGHGQGLPEFHTEISVLSQIRHRHLVSLIGYCEERSEMILIYEFMEKGTLRDHLYNLKGESGSSTSRSELSWKQRLEICIGAAEGINYLHTGSSGTIIHRDIKSTNILLDEHYVAKVADFGLSRSSPLDQTHVITEVKGSFGYLDPEYYICSQLTQKSDVYSFGVVLLEVLCARPAVDNSLPAKQVNLAEWAMSWQKNGQLEKIVDPFLVGKINPNSLRQFAVTVEKCLQENGNDRPNMVDVLWDLKYSLLLQDTAMPREPHEDSTTDVTWELPIQRLPSQSLNMSEYEASNESYNLPNASRASESEVFSLLKIDEPR